jgi:hypothetical protein
VNVISIVANRKLWLRAGGSLLVGMVFGANLDMICQLIAFKGDMDRTFPPIFGWAVTSVIVFGFWNRLAAVRLHGFVRSLAIGALIGMAAGTVVGALVYPRLSLKIGSKSSVFTEQETNESETGEGAVIGLIVGALIGGVAGGVTHLLQKPKENCVIPAYDGKGDAPPSCAPTSPIRQA